MNCIEGLIEFKVSNNSSGLISLLLKVATYATLSMGYFEIKLYSVCAFKYGELLAKYVKENWNRFLDDCYTVLRSSKISPEELLLTLNSINPSIQFTMKYSKDQIPFLDILIKRNENGIWMDLYHKPKRNIPFCLAQRICTIVENNTEKLKNLENLKPNLSKHHYPNSLIKQGFQKALSIPQKDLRKMKISCHSLQHLIQITLIFMALLNPWLFV